MLELKEEKKDKKWRATLWLVTTKHGHMGGLRVWDNICFFCIKGGILFKHATLAPHTDVFQPIHIKL
jgi:hypothetical protein